MDAWISNLVESMFCYVGQTVTIFTTSGGISGSGFTGVLISVDCNNVKLLCDVGAAPACPIGSSCMSLNYNNNNNGGSNGCGCNGSGNAYGNLNNVGGFNPLGSVAVIPTRAIACFTHNAI